MFAEPLDQELAPLVKERVVDGGSAKIDSGSDFFSRLHQDTPHQQNRKTVILPDHGGPEKANRSCPQVAAMRALTAAAETLSGCGP